MMRRRRQLLKGIGAVGATGFLAGCTGGGNSGSSPTPTSDQMSWEEIVSAAQEEGSTSYYTAGIRSAEEKMIAAYKEKYGISVDMFRSGGSKVLQRYNSEVKAGDYKADVIMSSNPSHLVTLAKQGLLSSSLQDIPNVEKIPDEHVHGNWISHMAWTTPIIFNKNVLDRSEVPKSWSEFASDEFSGQTVTASPQYAGTAVAMVAAWRKMNGDYSYLKKLGNTDILVRQGYGDSQSAVLSGDRPIGIGISVRALPAIADDASIGVVIPEEGTPATISGGGIPKQRPHQNSAKVFTNFMVGPGTEYQAKVAAFYPIVGDTPPLGLSDADWLPTLDEFKPIYPDVEWMTENLNEIQEKWTQYMG